MQTQSPFGPLLGLSPMLPSPIGVPQSNPPVSMATFPSAFAAFASQIRNTQLQSLLQSQIQVLNGANNSGGRGFGGAGGAGNPHIGNNGNSGNSGGGKVRGTTEYPLRKRVGGSTVKTAKVWRYFDELPTIEQAAECRICRKKIKATNSSTTGMIRHLRSCHVQEYQLVQEARQNSMIVKMEEKARAKLLREMNEKVISNGIENHSMSIKKEATRENQESQKSPSASSSASDTASSASSSHFSQLIGLPAPIPIKPVIQNQNINPLSILQNIKCEATEVEEEDVGKPTDLSLKMMTLSPVTPSVPQKTSAFCAVGVNCENEKMNEFQKKIEDDHKIHMQIALMLLLDQQPSHLIDRPGFRSLFKFLLPDYHLPTGDIFQATIVPQLLNHMKQQIGAIFNTGAPGIPPQSNPHQITSDVVTTPTATSSAATSSYEEVSVNESGERHPDDDEDGEEGTEDVEMGTEGVGEEMEEDVEEEEEEHVEIEEDDHTSSASSSTSSSSVDPETCDSMASFIHFIGNDSFPHDELISLLSVVTNLFAYFSTRPHVQGHLQMTVIPSTVPPLVQQIRFVASNLSIISDYIRSTPDMQLLPLAVNQEVMLGKLVDHIDQLQ